MTVENDPETIARFARTAELTNARIREMSQEERQYRMRLYLWQSQMRANRFAIVGQEIGQLGLNQRWSICMDPVDAALDAVRNLVAAREQMSLGERLQALAEVTKTLSPAQRVRFRTDSAKHLTPSERFQQGGGGFLLRRMPMEEYIASRQSKTDYFLSMLRAFDAALAARSIPYAITQELAEKIHGAVFPDIRARVVFGIFAAQEGIASELKEMAHEISHAEDGTPFFAIFQGNPKFQAKQRGPATYFAHHSGHPYYEAQLERRASIHYGTSGPSFWVISAEDAILSLLQRRATSTGYDGTMRTWNSVVEIMYVNHTRFDWKYMRKWADEFHLRNDLDNALAEAESI